MASFMDRFIKPDYFKNSDKNRRRPDRYRDEYADRRREAEKERSFSQFEEDFGFTEKSPARPGEGRESGYPADDRRRPAPQPQRRPAEPRPRMSEPERPRMSEPERPRMPEPERPRMSEPERPRMTEPARPVYREPEEGRPISRRAADKAPGNMDDPFEARVQSRYQSDDYDSFDSFDMPAEEAAVPPEDDYYFDSFDEPYDMPAREAATARDMAEAEVIPMPQEHITYEPAEPEAPVQPQPVPQQDYRLANVLEDVAQYLEELQEENSQSKEDTKKNKEMIEQINQLIGETVLNLQGMQQGFQEYVQNSHNEENYQAVMAQTQILDEKVENLTVLLQEIVREQEERPDITEHLAEQNRILEEMSIQIKESQEVVQNLEGRFDQLKEELVEEQKELLGDKERTRRKDFAITRTYFRTIMWLLLIIIVMLGAWLLGFIGPVGSTSNPAAILLGLLTL